MNPANPLDPILIVSICMGKSVIILKFKELKRVQGPELQCLLKVKDDLSLVLIFQNAKNNVSNSLQ